MGNRVLDPSVIRPLEDVLEQRAAEFGAKAAFADSQRSVSYAELALRTRRIAGHLHSMGVFPGDRVAICVGNRVEAVETAFAAVRAAAVCVLIDPNASAAELAFRFDDSGAKVVFVDSARRESVTRLAAERPHLRVVLVEGGPGDLPTLEALTDAEPEPSAFGPAELDAAAWLLYTSGTTSRSKGAVATARSHLWSAGAGVQALGLGDTDVLVCSAPVFHIFAHVCSSLAGPLAGATVHLTDGLDASRVLALAAAVDATCVLGVPAFYHRLVDAAASPAAPSLDRLRFCLSAGSMASTQLLAAFGETFGVSLLDQYGSTETSGYIFTCRPTQPPGDASQQEAIPGAEIRIVDITTQQDAPAGAEGEIWVRSPGNMIGYHGQPAETAMVLTDGYFRTGDLGRRTAEDRYTITGRLKETIIRGGDNVHPAEIEDVVRQAAGVRDVAVAGRGHPVLGEVPIAFVVPSEAGFRPEEVFEVCRDRLPHFKVPEELYEVADLPRNAGGKLLRRELPSTPARLRALGRAWTDGLSRSEWRVARGRQPGDDTDEWTVVPCPEGDPADVVRELSGLLADAADPVLVVTRGADTDLGQAAGWGLAEARQAHRRLVLVDAGENDQVSSVARQAIARRAPQVVVRGDVLLPHVVAAPTRAGATPPSMDGTVLVDGAETGHAAELALHLRTAYGVRGFLLVSPSGAPDLARRLTQHGAEVTQLTGRLTGAGALTRPLEQLSLPLTTVLHCAAEETDEELAAAVATALDEISATFALDAVLLSTSVRCGPVPRLLQTLARRHAGAGRRVQALMWDLPEDAPGRERRRLFDAALLTEEPVVLLGDWPRDESDAPAVRSAAVPAGGEQTLDRQVRAAVHAVLGTEVPDDRVNLPLAGLTSLSAVALSNELAGVTGLDLPSTLAFDYPSPAQLTAYLAERLTGAGRRRAAEPAEHPGGPDEPIAIVAMSCRLPGGVRSPEELWDLLASGAVATGPFPTDRGWNLEDLFDPDPGRSGTTYVRTGGFLDDAAEFDAAFFGIAPREAAYMDPQQRLVLESTWDLLERAGLRAGDLRGSRTGVFLGTMYHDYVSRFGAQTPRLDRFMTAAGTGGVVSGRVAYTFGFEGPAVSVDTACSSSLVSLHLAVQALRTGECSLAVAGGVTVMSTPDAFIQYSRQRGLAPDGICKPFAASADGTAWAEGVALLLVERLADAERAGHPILAVVRGSAINQDGASQGMAAPNGTAQQRLIESALARSGLTPAEVDAVEAHANGSRLGDPIEARALQRAYGPDRARPLLLGTMKSNVGHAQAASGAAGVIKMVMAIQHATLPRTLHADEPTREVDWSTGDLELLTESREWPATDRLRRAGVSSFGLSGTNAHVIVEQYPDPPVGRRASGVAGPVPWVLTAHSAPALCALARSMRGTEEDIQDVAYTLARTRTPWAHRAVVVADSLDGLRIGLDRVADAEPTTPAQGPVAVLFTGRGAHRRGMGEQLRHRCPAFAAALDEVMAYVPDGLSAATEDKDHADGLEDTEYAQVAIFAFEVALYRLWESWGLRPGYVAGHSVGEITAAHVAGVLSLEDAVTVITARGRLMRTSPSGGALPEDFAAAIADVRFGEPSVPLVSMVTGRSVDPGEMTARHWTEHAQAPVRFAETVRWLTAHGVGGFLELGTDEVLTGMVRRTLGATARAVAAVGRDRDETATLLAALGEVFGWGADLDWPAIVGGGRLVPLPTYPFQREHFWLDLDGTTDNARNRAIATIGSSASHHSGDALPESTTDHGLLRWEWMPQPVPAGRSDFDVHTVRLPEANTPADMRAALRNAFVTVQQRLASGVSRPLVVEVPYDRPTGAAVWGMLRVAQSEHPGAVVLVDTDHDESSRAALPSLVASGLTQARLRAGEVAVPRLVPAGSAVQVPPALGHWRLDTDEPGTLENVRVTVSPDAGRPLAAGEVRVAVRTAGLNFRDALLALGRYPGQDAAIGAEGAGVVIDVGPAVDGLATGDRVAGLFPHAVADVAVVDRRHLVPVPDSWSFAQAAAFPIVFLTAVYALRELAGLQAGDKVLIHAAAGGVGLAAVQVAQAAGAEIFATCSPGKRRLLRESGIAEDHIASSRDVGFAEKVRAATGGRGVDVILNSLAGELAATSAKLLVPGGRFVEIGARDLRDDSWPTGVRHHHFTLTDAGPRRIATMLAEVVEELERGTLQHLPVRRWELGEARTALRSLSQGRTSGKNVVAVPRTLDRPVLVTGGTGGIGSLFARHLVADRGARDIVLASRRGPDAEHAGALRAELERLGAQVRIVACDVSDRQALAALLEDTGPLSGVVHAAAVPSDSLFTDVDAEREEAVLRPRADAAWWLHELTRGHDLALFVLFNSVASAIGTPGQAVHAAADGCLEALALIRRDLGLPGTTIAWGSRDGATGVTRNPGRADSRRPAEPGVCPPTDDEAHRLFDAALSTGLPHLVAVGPADAPSEPDARRSEVLEVALRREDRAVDEQRDSRPEFLASGPQRRPRLVQLVREHVAVVLGYSSAHTVDTHSSFRELGFDSLGAVELRNRLSAVTGLRLPAALAFDRPTVDAVADLLDSTLPGAAGRGAEAPARTELNGLRAVLANLGDDRSARERIARELRVLLDLCGADDAHGDEADDLSSADDEELFSIIDGRDG